MEVMGCHAGWIAAAGALAAENPGDPPQIILLPEVPFDQTTFLDRVQQYVLDRGFCVIVVSEGVRNATGQFLSETGLRDAFGHAQLGGVAPTLAQIVKENLGHKFHWAVADYLQRSARHIASQTDVDQAYAMGRAAVEFALEGKNAVMPTIVRKSDDPYEWEVGSAELGAVANVEKKLPAEYISSDGFGVTEACLRYLRPLIEGEAYPPYKNGLPQYVTLKAAPVEKKLK